MVLSPEEIIAGLFYTCVQCTGVLTLGLKFFMLKYLETILFTLQKYSGSCVCCVTNYPFSILKQYKVCFNGQESRYDLLEVSVLRSYKSVIKDMLVRAVVSSEV